MWKILTFIILIPAISVAQVFEHEGKTPLLVELYTSEGCSSCPPADDFMGALKTHPDLWEEIVPLAFHVDYWDYIGWKDPLASPVFSQRQRDLKQSGALKAVYTPGWVVDGVEWRDYFRRAPFPDAPNRRGGKLIADLSDTGLVNVSYIPRNKLGQSYEVHVALLGFDISHQVTAGENRGATLNHDFVVLEHTQYSVIESLDVQLEKLDQSMKQALVVWVTPEGRHEPEQIVSGWVAVTP